MVVLADVPAQVRALRELHDRLGRTSPGPRPTPSAPPTAGPANGGRGAGLEPEVTVADLVAPGQREAADTDPARKGAKALAIRRPLELRGLRSLRECGEGDTESWAALARQLEGIGNSER